MTAPDHTTKPLKNTLRERGHPYMEFEGGVISALFQQRESALARRWRLRREKRYHEVGGRCGRRKTFRQLVRSDRDGCRFRNLDSSVPMMEPAKDRMRNDVSEPLDRACTGRVLPERNMRSHLVIIYGHLEK